MPRRNACIALELADEEVGEEFTRYFNPWRRGTMVLTDKKKWLSRYFSRLPRESLCTPLMMFFMGFSLLTKAVDKTAKLTVSA
jgi:hypothetical protein